jgi:hypothetical protein
MLELQEMLAVTIGNRIVTGLLDSGAQASLINEELFNQLIDDNLEIYCVWIYNRSKFYVRL